MTNHEEFYGARDLGLSIQQYRALRAEIQLNKTRCIQERVQEMTYKGIPHEIIAKELDIPLIRVLLCAAINKTNFETKKYIKRRDISCAFFNMIDELVSEYDFGDDDNGGNSVMKEIVHVMGTNKPEHFSYDKERHITCDIRSDSLKGNALITVPVNWEEMDPIHGEHSFWFEVEFVQDGAKCIIGLYRMAIGDDGETFKMYQVITEDMFFDIISGIENVIDFNKCDVPYEFRANVSESDREVVREWKPAEDYIPDVGE